MGWFVNIITYSPLQVLVTISVWHIGILYFSINDKKFPRFQDPQLGFETRGTEIAQRLTAWEQLMKESSPSGSLVINPRDIPPKVLSVQKKGPEVIVQDSSHRRGDDNNAGFHDGTGKNTMWQEIQQIGLPKRQDEEYPNDEEIKKLSRFNSNSLFFCDHPNSEYVHLVIASKNGSDLFNLEVVRQICKMQTEIESLSEYKNSCFPKMTAVNTCCRMWSLPNYIGWFNRIPECEHITNQHVVKTLSWLKTCFEYYHDRKLIGNNGGNGDVPKKCLLNNAAFDVIHYILDADFLQHDKSSRPLQTTSLFLPVAKSSAQLKLYHQIENMTLSTDIIRVEAMDLGLKYLLFDDYLVRDTRLLLFTSVFIIVCIWLYTGCAFITILTVIAILFSLVLSYSIYTDVLRLKFFPFMNILAVIVALGIGSDDAYIICKVWDRTKKENSHLDKAKLVELVIKHSTVAVFVTTLTTVAAFLSSYVSSVTAVRCFSVFAGLSVLANFTFMITWILAGIVISSDWPFLPILHWGFNRNSDIVYENILIARSTFNDRISDVIGKYHKWLISIFSVISLLSMYSVIFWPRLQVPDSAEFQLFHQSHPFEQYDLIYKYKFWFNRIFSGENAEEKLPLRFVWGVLPIDDGNYLDPTSRGNIYYDSTFDIADNSSQEWLLKFCRKLRMQPFYRETYDPMISNCFIETFKQWMERKCYDPVDRVSNKPCCEVSTFPYSRRVFNHCILQAMEALYKTPQHFFISDVAGLRFSKDPLQKFKIKALVVEFDSTMSYTTSFEAMNTFYQQVDTWSKEEFAKSPEGMKNGWYVTHLAFYDLQRTLTQDTGISIFISMSIALLVLFMVTLNIPLSLYAILTITCIIFVSVAILIGLGWKLNVLESIAISVTIGLSVDFSLHYAVNYRLAPDKTDRRQIVVHALSMMAGPSLMAAITTGSTGLFMLFSIVLPYIQIGIFLMVVSTVSWLYSTFFLMSLLYSFGPENDYGQFTYPNFGRLLDTTRKKMHSLYRATCNRFKSEKIYSLQEMETLNQSVADANNSSSSGSNNYAIGGGGGEDIAAGVAAVAGRSRSKSFSGLKNTAANQPAAPSSGGTQAAAGKRRTVSFNSSTTDQQVGSVFNYPHDQDYQPVNMNTYVIT